MNALTRTFADMTAALQKARQTIASEPDRVADFLDDNPRFGVACAAYGIRLDFTIPQAIAFVEKQIGRQAKSREAKHWTYCGNKLVALRQVRIALLERHSEDV